MAKQNNETKMLKKWHLLMALAALLISIGVSWGYLHRDVSDNIEDIEVNKKSIADNLQEAKEYRKEATASMNRIDRTQIGMGKDIEAINKTTARQDKKLDAILVEVRK